MHAMETLMKDDKDTANTKRSRARAIVLAATCLALATAPTAAPAQSFDNQDASENIADSEISVDDTKAAERTGELLENLASLPETTDRIKIITTMDRIDVVYLSDLIGENAPKEVREAIEANDERIDGLQQALEGSALFYNALSSRNVNLADVVTVRLEEPDATIFVRGVPPDQGVSLDAVNPEDGEATDGSSPADNSAGPQPE